MFKTSSQVGSMKGAETLTESPHSAEHPQNAAAIVIPILSMDPSNLRDTTGCHALPLNASGHQLALLVERLVKHQQYRMDLGCLKKIRWSLQVAGAHGEWK